MSKRANRGKTKSDGPIAREKAPPLLSEELIAQMQRAVSAAQRKRMPGLDEASMQDDRRPLLEAAVIPRRIRGEA
jgi:hypothetical protein